ncbi:hypothetical protein GPECTOR_171g195 [Gonium pectorale]|uniref:Serine-threonine/tyrosine-protein kinase catalytic domain-containing protein n=1 Tax=Gonium pectorale TaxID=33097 RepID=A0A150FXE1_GONPE|nr:hypothetical protein GPECTOR_171g195 [Gonium pectorale]|eukprot:KXZ42269.1 hypothetical protein GPECTOR_171g195 [Gonium pectorale]
MATGGPPFQELRPAQVLVGLATGELALAWPEWVDPRVARIGRACMDPDPARRPAFDEVVRQLLSEIGALSRSARQQRQQRAAAAQAAAAAAAAAGATASASAQKPPLILASASAPSGDSFIAKWSRAAPAPVPPPAPPTPSGAPPQASRERPVALAHSDFCEWQPVSLPLMQLHRL